MGEKEKEKKDKEKEKKEKATVRSAPDGSDKDSVYCRGKRHTYPIAEAPVGHNILSQRVAYVQLNAQLAPVIIVLTSVYSQKDIL